MLWALSIPLIAQASGSDDYAARFAKAQSLVQRGDDVAASKIYQELIKQDPSQPQAYNNLAAIKARHGELKQAQALLEQALRSNPVYATVYDNLSAIYVEMARDSYGKALHLETPQQAIALHDVDGPTAGPASRQTAALPVQKLPENPPATLNTTVASPETAQAKPHTPTPVVAPVKKPEPAPASQIAQTTSPPSAKPPLAEAIVGSVSKTAMPAAVETTAEPPPVLAPAVSEAKAPAPEASSRVAAASEPATINNEELVTTLQGWAAAWSDKAVDLYLSFYSNEYAPAGMTHAQWQAQRRQRLLAPKWIRVSLNDVQVKVIKADEADVRLIQHYQADNYQDRTRKALRLRHTADGWRIIEENTLATLP